MRKHRIPAALVFTGILLLLVGLVFGNAVALKLSDIYGRYSAGKVVVSLTKEAGSQPDSLFTPDDIDELSDILKSKEITAAAENSTMAEWGNHASKINVRGVNSNYPNFLTLNVIEGSFFTGTDEEEGSQVAVMDEELALALFNTKRVIGNKVELLGRNFRIIGVVSRDSSIVGDLTAKKEPTVYVPLAILLELDKNTGISVLQISNLTKDLLGGNEDAVKNALNVIGKNPSDYILEDYSIKETGMRQKASLLVFIPGVLLLLTLAVLLVKRIRKLASQLVPAFKAGYFTDVFTTRGAWIFKEIIRALLVLLSMVLVWLGIRFRLYLPQKYIPDELIDLSFYADLFKDSIQQINSLIGYKPPAEGILLGVMQSLMEWIFYPTLLVGIPVMYIGLYQLKREKAGLTLLTVLCSIFTALSAVIATMVTTALGMPVNIDLKGLLVIYAFIFINSILFSNEREEVF